VSASGFSVELSGEDPEFADYIQSVANANKQFEARPLFAETNLC
jgi:hypothetical protein